MKNLIKLVIASAMLIVSAKAQSTFATNNLAVSTNHTILTAPMVIESITLWSTNASPTTVKFLDGWATSTNAAWTNKVFTSQSVVTAAYTVTSGATNGPFTNIVYKSTSTEHAAAVIVTVPLMTVTVPASGVLITIDDPIAITKRLTLDVSAAGLSFNMKYRTNL
jgi:hypothetical protein